MGYDIGHFDNDFVDTLVEMMCYQVSRPLTMCPYFHFENLKQMVRNISKTYNSKVVDLENTFPMV
jgi:hypothetical protein